MLTKLQPLARLMVLIAMTQLATAHAAITAPAVRTFIEDQCLDCHDSETKKGNLDLSALKPELAEPANFTTWITVHDRVQKGEMPPPRKGKTPPDAGTRTAFVADLAAALTQTDQDRVSREGRATQRRLNRYEYEETLRDLLSLPCLEVKSFLPEDSEAHGFNKVGDALDVSHVQMARYLSAAEFALQQAMAPQSLPPQTTTNRYYTWEQGGFFGRIPLGGPKVRRTFPLVGLDLQLDIMADPPRRHQPTEDPERRQQEAMAVVVSTYEPTEISFNEFKAPFTGRYRLRFSAYSIWMSLDYNLVTKGRRSEPVTIYSDIEPRLLRKLGSFDVGVEPAVNEMEVWLLAGETIRPDAARFFRARPPDFKNPLAEKDGMPGLAFQWMDVEGPLVDQWPPAGHQALFETLPMADRPRPAVEEAGSEDSTRRRRARFQPPPGVEILSENPMNDSQRLVERFMKHAYARPVAEGDTRPFVELTHHALATGHSFTDAVLAGYTAILSSPAFLYFDAKPGPLTGRALADRLSYFLWNSRPDDELARLARDGTLHQPVVLRQQTERLLNEPRSRQFVNAFLDYWLDLREIAGTAPDTELYPDYQLDDLLVESMIEEPQLFFTELLRRDLAATNLVQSDFALLNERLAAHYGIDDVHGVGLRPVSLPRESLRGGLLTQASILKVTANGTTTSPVLRGTWILSRIIGKPMPPPPAAVPAVEPDIRGATTIREQLAKHRSDTSCASCHRHIDPPGFALESFDVMGGWRDHYRSLGEGEKIPGIGHNGLTFHFKQGQPVDDSGEMADGRTFKDVRELKQLLAADDEQLARNLARQLIVYATGAPIGFSDRARVEKILASSRPGGYGVRTLVHEIIQSELFRNK